MLNSLGVFLQALPSFLLPSLFAATQAAGFAILLNYTDARKEDSQDVSIAASHDTASLSCLYQLLINHTHYSTVT